MDEGPDPWDELNARYRYDDHAQFLLFAEQLAATRELILSNELTKLRLALVAVDNLAELLMHRQVTKIRRLSEGSPREQIPRLSRSDLEEVKRDFAARVRVARSSAEEGALLWTTVQPLLDDGDDAVFRAAHSYRNRVYHADHHNAAILPLITRSYLAAVGRAFVRFQPRNVGSSMDSATSQLARHGYEGSADDFHRGKFFRPAEAAEAVTAKLVGDLEVELSEAKEVLQADLEFRCEWALAMLSHLQGDGMPVERLIWSIRWGEFWNEAGIDDEVVALDRQMANVWAETIRHEGDKSEHFQRWDDLNAMRNERVIELRQDFEPRVRLTEIPRLQNLASRLSTARNIGHLFSRYRKLDEEMERIEEVLDGAAIGWDRFVQEEVDRARGK